MVYSNRIKPSATSAAEFSDQYFNGAPLSGSDRGAESVSSSKDFDDFDSISTVQLEESSFLKLKPFSKLDPTLLKWLNFNRCFGLFLNTDLAPSDGLGGGSGGGSKRWARFMRVFITLTVAILTSEVVYDVNLRQSKLLAEQKRSTPLLTFVIVAYSWLTLIIPLICDISLVTIGPYLFRFYSRTTATVCNGAYFGRSTSVDSLVYYLGVSLLCLFDVIGQVVLLGVWPTSVNPYMSMFIERKSTSVMTTMTNSTAVLVESDNNNNNNGEPRITAHVLDYILGEEHAHGDLGVSIKILCLFIQLVHSYSFLGIIISFANHYATIINSINENLAKYEFRRLLRQLIILRDSSEQISLMISIPFSLIIMLVFMRLIALNGVFIQSTMQSYENWALSLQSFTCSVCIFMVFIYCDGLQSASKQTHRLKTEQTVINENRGGNQSIYEFLDYLDRLSKTIRITFFNIIAINKSSLVGLYGHILTLTFVTS